MNASLERNQLSAGLQISPTIFIAYSELELTAITAQGPGGQNVNKVANAIHLRFDSASSSLSDDTRQRLLALNDQRVSKSGVIVIKAQNSRSQEKNKAEAFQRLTELIRAAITVAKKRRATKATYSSQKKRLDSKTKRGQTKLMRGKITD